MKQWIASVVVVLHLMSGTAQAEEKFLSEKLATVGLLTTVVGIGIIAYGGTTYHVLGDDYCVTDYSVDYGNCRSPQQMRVGLITVGAGVVMMIIGYQKVNVSPMIGPGVKGVSARIQWGGSHAKR